MSHSACRFLPIRTFRPVTGGTPSSMPRTRPRSTPGEEKGYIDYPAVALRVPHVKPIGERPQHSNKRRGPTYPLAGDGPFRFAIASERTEAELDNFYLAWSPRLLSVLRIATSLLFLQHATAKLFAFPHVPLTSTISSLASLLGVAGLIELVGGVLVLLGCSCFGLRSSCRARWQ